MWYLLDIIKLNILPLFRFEMPELNEYAIPDRPTKQAPVLQREAKSKVDKFGFAGAWKDSQHYEAVNVNVKGEQGTKDLDRYDAAHLSDHPAIGDKWKKTEAAQHSTRQIKELWSEGKSAKDISKILPMSERKLDDYVKAFNNADNRREQEGQERIRKT